MSEKSPSDYPKHPEPTDEELLDFFRNLEFTEDELETIEYWITQDVSELKIFLLDIFKQTDPLLRDVLLEELKDRLRPI